MTPIPAEQGGHDEPNLALLEAARAAAARGWPVFPLCRSDKIPVLHGEGRCPRTGPCVERHRGWEDRATTDPDRITACWSTDAYNVGIVTGPAGLVVIDLDVPKPGDTVPDQWRGAGITDGHDVLAALCEHADQPFPTDTYTVATPSGGTHLYFRHPTDGPQLRITQGGGPASLGWKVDTRAHGGYVLAAGSTTTQGTYRVVHDVAPAPLPSWLAERLTPTPLPPQRPVRVDLPTSRCGRYLHAAITRQVDEITNAPKGGRNAALYTSAAALGQLVAGGGLDEATVSSVLARAALQAGLRPREVERTLASGLRAGARRPRSIEGIEGAAA